MTESYTVSFEGDLEMEFDAVEREQFMDGANMDSKEEFYQMVEERVEEQLHSVFMAETVDNISVTAEE